MLLESATLSGASSKTFTVAGDYDQLTLVLVNVKSTGSLRLTFGGYSGEGFNGYRYSFHNITSDTYTAASGGDYVLLGDAHSTNPGVSGEVQIFDPNSTSQDVMCTYTLVGDSNGVCIGGGAVDNVSDGPLTSVVLALSTGTMSGIVKLYGR